MHACVSSNSIVYIHVDGLCMTMQYAWFIRLNSIFLLNYLLDNKGDLIAKNHMKTRTKSVRDFMWQKPCP